MLCAQNGHVAAMCTLLEAKAEVNKLSGRVEAYGDPINSSSETKTSALHMAAYNGHIAAIQMLLDRKADLETQMPRPNRKTVSATPIMASAAGGQPAAVRLL